MKTGVEQRATDMKLGELNDGKRGIVRRFIGVAFFEADFFFRE